MTKKTLKHTINEMKRLSSLMPYSINEAMDTFDYIDNEEHDENDDVEILDDKSNIVVTKGSSVPPELSKKVSDFIDNVRKTSLQGMADLAEYPESMEYEFLKKLWQTTDKRPENKKEV